MRIRALRESTQRSQKAVASAVGVSERAYQAWEAGGNLTWPNAVALARVLGTTPSEIIDQEPEADTGRDPLQELHARGDRQDARFLAHQQEIGGHLMRIENELAAIRAGLSDMAAALSALRTGEAALPLPGSAEPPPPASNAKGNP
jgi:transcriptional regulator with XRE-family HTH domain